jgi:hypothetical protein
MSRWFGSTAPTAQWSSILRMQVPPHAVFGYSIYVHVLRVMWQWSTGCVRSIPLLTYALPDTYYFALTNFGSGQSATFSVDLKSAISLSMCRVTDVWSDESISPATSNPFFRP